MPYFERLLFLDLFFSKETYFLDLGISIGLGTYLNFGGFGVCWISNIIEGKEVFKWSFLLIDYLVFTVDDNQHLKRYQIWIDLHRIGKTQSIVLIYVSLWWSLRKIKKTVWYSFFLIQENYIAISKSRTNSAMNVVGLL